MNPADLLQRFVQHPELTALGRALHTAKNDKCHVKGLVGSQTAFVAAALHHHARRNLLLILNDREEALYLFNDLQAIYGNSAKANARLHYFPASYRKPYQIEDVDNANVLQRAEVLNDLNHAPDGGQIIVTFAEALHEKVVNRRSLVQHTLDLKVGMNCGMDFVAEVLEEYGFERVDFVHEPGQYALRGGLMDVYSFAHELPFRLDFDGDEIEVIREFNPETQISDRKVKNIALIPNIQKNLLLEERISFFQYISDKTLILPRSIEFIQADLERMFARAGETFYDMVKKSGGGIASKVPADMFLSGDALLRELAGLNVVEIGNNHQFMNLAHVLNWKGSAQPAFHKEFELMATHFKQNQHAGIETFVFSDNPRQLTRLEEIFTATDAEVRFTGVDAAIHEGFTDQSLKIACYTDHQIFDRFHRSRKKNERQGNAITLKELQDLQPGDFITHIKHGIGVFAGLHTIQVGEHWQDAAKIVYKNGDEIFVGVNSLHKIARYTGKEGIAPALSVLGGTAWEKAKAKTKKRIKELAFDIVSLYARRKAMKGFAFTPDNYMQQELEASFMYEDTPDQITASDDVKNDMMKPYPMDRLVCGDVGFGKTEIAMRAAFKAVLDGKQVAILVPTTILALQHYKSFAKRFKEFPVTVDYVNRFKTSQEEKETLAKVAKGQVDILIGTHRLVSDDIKFKDLGLMIIDEEQRFGVNIKEKLRSMKASIDTLTLTATPIPRTLQFSLLNIRDLSVIATPPPNRQPIETTVMQFSLERLRDIISYELKRGGQVFFIHPRVQDIEEVASTLKTLVPDARIGIGHGQMTGHKLEEVMTTFIEGGFDILVATTIIESGLDIANANTIIINEANKYGLSELHQMRGRVGRSNRKAFCYLLAPPEISQTSDARKRLKAMEEFSDLGSGFHIAMRDLDIRGAGDLLGADQSGFIGEIGYDVYHRILDETISELKEEHFGELFKAEINEREVVDDCQIDLEADIRIPDTYLASTAERLNLYRRIAATASEDELVAIQREMLDRFGALPLPVLNLFDVARIQRMARKLGLERIVQQKGVLRCFFISNKESRFYDSEKFTRVLAFVQLYSARVKLKQTDKNLSLVYHDINSLKRVLMVIEELYGDVVEAGMQTEVRV